MLRSTLAAAIAFALVSPAVHALTDEEGTSAIQFNFNNPGARSRAMGGAFLALADDATAAYTNPAGLTQLSRREMSVEWRQTNFSTPHLASGLADFPTRAFYERADSSVAGPSFVSAVFPLGKVSLAFFRHTNADFNTRFSYENPADRGLLPFVSRVDLSDAVYGVSAGYALSDHPYQAIIDAARRHGCDAIFMSSHGRKGLARLLHGSQTFEVLAHSDIPTLVYR